MNRLSSKEIDDMRTGLRIQEPPSPQVLKAEREELSRLESEPFFARTAGYMKMVGPAYLQSAMTLGASTAASALYAGALFGYELLWVAPIAMLMGLVMLAAVAHQTLSTGLRPFDAMARFAGRPIAWAWALGALLASIIWHFPQYVLASACLVDIGEALGVAGLRAGWMGVLILAWALLFSFTYGRSPRLSRLYEKTLKYIVWGIIGCFGLVVFQTGISDWGELLSGFFPHTHAGEHSGISRSTLILSGLSAAVGVNMVFLYPYSLLARGWGPEHRRLARFDLVIGMYIPYVLAATLMLIAAANTIHLDPGYDGTRMSPVAFAESLASGIGPVGGRFVFDLGILGMAMTTITAHMVCTGFVGVELFGLEVGSWKHRLATLVPIPGVLGPLFWSDIAIYIALPTSIACGLFLPLAYLGFTLLQRSRAYLGKDRPEGGIGALWTLAMGATTIFMAGSLAWYIWQQVTSF